MAKTVTAAEARKQFSDLLKSAERGQATLIIRNSKPAAALVPADLADYLKLTKQLLHELGLSALASADADIVEQVRQADAEIARGDIVWYDEE